MGKLSAPPAAYQTFVTRYPLLGKAWELMGEAGKEGPLDEKTARLIKLAIAIGAMREGAVHASVRKARALGISQEEIQQVVALAVGVLGMPSTVAIHSWVQDEVGKEK
ncbi:MAG: carboxymuconolactone decarboxylase family protein [Candidatus Latescibacteria bacterium]|jgi:alkylhydroperoxidase/carboxymuconolactone decarboxylase family protein YurZ|nr:carboxymuconolactone decarboxylase family protein [Candidatus Latescibacterota bacterium]